jgi:hypothetical protein
VHDQQQDGFLVFNENRDKADNNYSAVVIGKGVLAKDWLCGLYCFLAPDQVLF